MIVGAAFVCGVIVGALGVIIAAAFTWGPGVKG